MDSAFDRVREAVQKGAPLTEELKRDLDALQLRATTANVELSPYCEALLGVTDGRQNHRLGSGDSRAGLGA